MSEKTWTSTEAEYILNVIDGNMMTIGCIEFMFRIKKYKMPYLKWASVAMLFAIFAYGMPYYIFFLPLLPLLLLNIIYFVDMNIVVFSLTKSHSQFIREQFLIDWDELIDFTFQYFYNKSLNTNGKSKS